MDTDVPGRVTDDAGTDLDVGRPGPGPGLWIALVVVALVFGGAIGWRIGRSQGEPARPSASSVDVGFFRDMTTHHNQAVTMATDYLANGTDPLLRQLASEILLYQSSEIGVMNDHLSTWGRAATDNGTAMAWMYEPVPTDQMPGLATEAEMRELAAARGTALDEQFTRLMILHHAGGIHMAEYAAKHAETAVVRRWAASMSDGQKSEIAELNRWRVEHGMPSVPAVF